MLPLATPRAPAEITAPSSCPQALLAPLGGEVAVSRPDHDAIARVQRVRKLVLLTSILAMVGLAAVIEPRGFQGIAGGILGVCSAAAIGAAIVGRAWCSLYIGGRKKATIVDLGPYSISRNPLYLFSFIGAFGMGAQSGSLTFAAVFLLVAIAVFYLTVRKEEAWLNAAFGSVYAEYAARTPRFWPRFAGWRDAEVLEVQPAYFLLTLRDGSAMLLAPPLFAGLAWLRDLGVLPVLLQLP